MAQADDNDTSRGFLLRGLPNAGRRRLRAPVRACDGGRHRTTLNEIRPLGASAFGDLFFERRSGEVIKLDVLEGGVHSVAPKFKRFSDLMNSAEWQEQHLLSQGIALLKEKGIARERGQFFGFAPHPALAGKIDWARVVPLDAIVWNSICVQTLGVAP